MKLEIDVLYANKFLKLQNSFMQTAGEFGNAKICVQHKTLVIEGESKLDSPNLDSLCQNIASAFEKAGGYTVFVGIRTIDGVKTNTSHPFFKDNVQLLSIYKNGHLRWILFKDALDELGYICITDERMFVVHVY